MKPIPRWTSDAYAQFHTYVRYWHGQTINQTELIIRDSLSEEVQCSPIVKGDFINPNDWSYTVDRVHHARGRSLWQKDEGGILTQYTTIGPLQRGSSHPFLIDVPDDRRLYSTALSRLSDQIRSSADLSIALAELPSTLRMLNAIRSAKRYALSFKNWKRLISGISSARLEWSFGWKPLINDIFTSLENLLPQIESNFLTFTATASERLPNSAARIQFDWMPDPVDVEIIRSGRQICKISVTLENPGLRPDKFGTLNPAGIVWELIPYSFVVDWFYDVGSYLRNLETSLLYESYFRIGYVSYGTFLDSSYDARFNRTQGTMHWELEASSRHTYRKFSRRRLSKFPVPVAPILECDLGSGQLLNLAALLGSKLGLTRR